MGAVSKLRQPHLCNLANADFQLCSKPCFPDKFCAEKLKFQLCATKPPKTLVMFKKIPIFASSD